MDRPREARSGSGRPRPARPPRPARRTPPSTPVAALAGGGGALRIRSASPGAPRSARSSAWFELHPRSGGESIHLEGPTAPESNRGGSMPRAEWTDKQERTYEHIRDSAKSRGASTRRAKEIAARTANKERAQRGQSKTSSRSSTRDISSSRRGGLRSGRGGPKGRTKEQLYNEARTMGIRGRSRMNKAQLQRAVDRKKR